MKLDELSIFVLHLMDKVKAFDNQYTLIRVFGKAELLPGRIFRTLDYLVDCNLLEIAKIMYTVKYYRLTQKGKSTLAENYDAEGMRNFVNTIDKTGYYENLLNLMGNDE
ncbi:MAG TPA: hypothetical protein VNS32_08230 [Flavisolibacter sp.]|nr:hypothetical protein [Flavisolibacter sp.]HWJ91791.1 hypothetical protein [Flavisolibacter sp.]